MKTSGYFPRLSAILHELDLVPVHGYVAQNNPANGLPYHNQFHTTCMALSCYAGAIAAKLPLFEQRALVLAGLFHDYDHSGGRTPDAENIQRAKQALQVAAQVLSLPAELVNRSRVLIETTQFPPVEEARDESERIIRDGDMCQMLYDHWFEQIYVGLRAEMAHTRGPMTLEQFCALQPGFYRGIPLESTWGKTVQPLLRARVASGLVLAERTAQLMAEQAIPELQAYEKAETELGPLPVTLATH